MNCWVLFAWNGPSEIWTSSVRNVDPWMPIQYDKPNCTLLCPEPFPIPAGESRVNFAVGMTSYSVIIGIYRDYDKAL